MHGDPDAGAAAGCDELDGTAVGRVLDRVREQVTDDLRQSAGIAAHVQWPLGEVDREAVLRALRRVQLRLLVQQRRQVDPLGRQVDALVLDPLHLEEVLEQRGQPARLRVDDPEVVTPRRCVELALQQERREPEHARERRPQLVRDDADELRLPALALAQLLVLLLELVVADLQPLRHLVERMCQLSDLAGALLGEPVRELAAGDPVGAVGDRAHRSADRAREHDAEEGDQGHRGADCDGADEDGEVGALVGVGSAACAASLFSAFAEPAEEQAVDLRPYRRCCSGRRLESSRVIPGSSLRIGIKASTKK